MQAFQTYFSDYQIIRLLCKYRIKYAKQRHKVHLMRDISLHSSTLELLLSKRLECPAELSQMLPPRRQWKRINEKDRKNFESSTNINIESLRRTVLTVHIKVAASEISPPIWYERLSNFIKTIQERINFISSEPIKKPQIIPVKKENRRDCKKFRPISLYSLPDRIIIGQTARYLTNVFDQQLLDCSYAFRAVKKDKPATSHHDTVDHIIAFKNKFRGESFFVAECDIKKFFDCVNHQRIKNIFTHFVRDAKEYYPNYDDRATTFFNQYLDSYAFNLDVYPLKNSDFFLKLELSGGEFEWPEHLLKEKFYGNLINDLRIGVPQGGALSCLIANLLLHNVDQAVLNFENKEDQGYFRFCDDMILITVNKEVCNSALQRYISAIKKNFLLTHEPKEIGKYGKDFYNTDISKSKSPYRWSPHKYMDIASPWISFVGYQIRHDGSIRVRQKSMRKEIDKQKKELFEVLRALNHKDLTKINFHSRKSLKQQLSALEHRLIAMSVGKTQLHNYKSLHPSMCWTNGFKRLTHHAAAKTQLRRLDSKRNRQIFILKRKLSALNKQSDKIDPIIHRAKFSGSPFSYFGFLAKKMKIRNKKV